MSRQEYLAMRGHETLKAYLEYCETSPYPSDRSIQGARLRAERLLREYQSRGDQDSSTKL